MAKRETLPFRPTDNSPTTNHLYALEAQHWVKALNSAQSSASQSVNPIPIIGTILMMIVSLFFIVVTLLIKMFSYIFSSKYRSALRRERNNTFNIHQFPHEYNFIEKPTEEYYRQWK